MPATTLSAARVARYAGRPIAEGEWADLLFGTKAEFHALSAPDTLTIEATPDRLDLLCDAGLGRHLAGALGTASGGTPTLSGPAPRVGSVQVDASVAPIRPVLGAFELTPPAGVVVDPELLAEAIRFQELLHATIGADRRLASFGLYAVDRIRGPLRYGAVPEAEVRFVPLDGTEPIDGPTFLSEHPMAIRYGALGRTPGGPLVLRDSTGAVLSLPPILNAEGPGSVRAGDGAILLESTGTLPARVADGLGLLLLPFVAAGWSVAAVPVERPAGVPSVVDPRTVPPVRLRPATLASVAGEAIPPEEVRRALAASRLEVEDSPDGWSVRPPPWRPDLLQEVDLVEEVVLARGIPAEYGRLSPSAGRGRRRPESIFRERVRVALVGAGFSALFTPVLTPRDRNVRVGRAEALTVARPVSEETAVIRDRLLPTLVGALAHNVRSGYPQRLAEVGPAIVRDPRSESGGRTTYRAGFVEAADGAGFADAAARIDALLRPFGAIGVREPAELPGLIPGRAAILRIAGESIAEMGELRPELLEAERVPVPVAYGEIDLSALWPLVRRSEV